MSNNVDIARSAGHRYLVQTWSDGTQCDKTGQPRQIEVQFHCSMTVTDAILFVKETKTCHYVMVINTPRLCGEPGFKTRLEQRDEAFIRCREVLDSVDLIEAVDKSLPEAPHPFKRKARTPILGSPPPLSTAAETDDGTDSALGKKSSDVLRLALEALLSGGNSQQQGVDGSSVVVSQGNEGEIWIEFAEAEASLEGLQEQLEEFLAGTNGKLEKLKEALRAAGHNVDEDDEDVSVRKMGTLNHDEL